MRTDSSEFDHIEMRAQKGPFKPSGARRMGPHSRTHKAPTAYLYLFCEKPDDFTGLKPVSLAVGEETFPLKNWRDLLLKACDILARGNRQLFRQQALWVGKAFLAEEPKGLHAPRLHEPSGLFVELNQSANSIVRHVRLLFERAMYDLDEIVLTCSYGAPEGRPEKGNRSHAPSAKVAAGEDTAELESQFEADIAMYYPHGFDFKETSKRLVEARMGQPMPNGLCRALRARMFQRSDGIWLLPRMVASESTQERMTAQAKALLEKEGAFAMDALYAKFEGELHNVSPGHDFKLFFNKCIAEQVDGKVRGFEGWQVCFRAATADLAGWKAIGERIREVLASAGDAVSIEDILSQLPHLERDVIIRVGLRFIQGAILFSVDDIEYLKLLEAYYLPEDFGDTLAAFVAETEAKQGVASIVLLEAALDAKYGEGFRINFGLEDDAVFKQVISKAFCADGYTWNGDVFAAVGSQYQRNVADEFVLERKGVFHEDEFFAYALDKRGLNNHATLVCQYLRTRCIRLNKTMWISLPDFLARKVLNETDIESIRQFLKIQLGTAPVLHIGLLPAMAFDTLQPMVIEDNKYHWNAYSITSVVRHLIKDLNLVNDEPSPYYVTSMLLPDGVILENGDVVEYVLGVCRASGVIPQTIDDAFDYLKTRFVRMTKTAKLQAKIRNFWGF